MNIRKYVCVSLVSMALCNSMHASQSRPVLKSNSESPGTLTKIGVAVGIGMLAYQALKLGYAKIVCRFKKVEENVSDIQDQCIGISKGQRRIGNQVTEVDSKVDQVRDGVEKNSKQIHALDGTLNKTAHDVTQISQGQKVIGEQVQTVDGKVDLVHKSVQDTKQGITKEITALYATVNQNHDTEVAEITRAQSTLSSLQEVQKSTNQQLSEMSEDNQTQFKAVRDGQIAHHKELKKQSELLAEQKAALAAMSKTTKKVASGTDKTKRRVKALYNTFVRKTSSSDMEQISDSDSEEEVVPNANALTSKTTAVTLASALVIPCV